MALLIIPVILVAAWLLTSLWLNKEVIADLEIHNLGGETGTALVLYHPGPGTFHRRVIGGYVEGLVEGGWRVEVATASAQAPTDLVSVNLLVLGSPTYEFAPSRPIRRALERLGDLGNQPTVTILTGLGAAGRASRILGGQAERQGGSLVNSLIYYRLRPNDEENPVGGEENRALAVEMARQAALGMAPAAES